MVRIFKVNEVYQDYNDHGQFVAEEGKSAFIITPDDVDLTASEDTLQNYAGEAGLDFDENGCDLILIAQPIDYDGELTDLPVEWLYRNLSIAFMGKGVTDNLFMDEVQQAVYAVTRLGIGPMRTRRTPKDDRLTLTDYLELTKALFLYCRDSMVVPA